MRLICIFVPGNLASFPPGSWKGGLFDSHPTSASPTPPSPPTGDHTPPQLVRGGCLAKHHSSPRICTETLVPSHCCSRVSSQHARARSNHSVGMNKSLLFKPPSLQPQTPRLRHAAPASELSRYPRRTHHGAERSPHQNSHLLLKSR